MDTDLTWKDLAPEFQWLNSEDLRTSGLHVIALKPKSSIVIDDATPVGAL
ncbi:MAG: hypothetical protein OIF40_00525 [Mangrovicoccus sp.]|nr:hypothetical protein [Mangrovicoccus sp.]